MRLLRSFVVVASLCLCAAASAISQILIVQIPVKGKNNPDGDRSLIQILAQDFDDDGRIAPIAWGLSDPFFRAAVDDGILKNPPAVPDFEQAKAAADKLKAEYLLVVSIWTKEGTLKARAQLYRRGKLVWKDPDKDDQQLKLEEKNQKIAEDAARKNGQEMETEDAEDRNARTFSITVGGKLDLDSGLRSVARTWTQLLFSEPLKQFTPRPRASDPAPEQGGKPEVIEAAPVRKIDNKQLMTEVMKLLATGETNSAITILRDAVDAEPLDVERRRGLIMALDESGQSGLAAQEARRAAELMPDQVEFRVLAARCWTAEGNVDEALKDLNEAVARDPSSPATRLLLGEMSLAKLQIEPAMEHFNFLAAQAPSSDVFYGRALARALSGDGEGARKDLAESGKLKTTTETAMTGAKYRHLMLVVEASVNQSGDEIRSLQQRARVQAGNPELPKVTLELLSKVQALSGIVESSTPPKANAGSHERRLLALNLLVQCLTDMDNHFKDPTQDLISEATINLGEAIKQMAAAKEAYATENKRS
ncbi:MAG TPA: tetratricopeptide repeat protein [Fimbriimonadaceae bacterium]|nr:tetratricopeptide repeat protein [Fimbriimonadaceae bacterium]